MSESLIVQLVPEPDGDDQELADLTALLRDELLQTDVLTVEPVGETEPPVGGKGALAAIGGWLAVNVGSAVLREVVTRLAAWTSRNGRTVELSLGGDTLKITGASPEEQKRLIDAWLARQAASA